MKQKIVALGNEYTRRYDQFAEQELISKTGLKTYLIPTEYRNTYFGKCKKTHGRLHTHYYHGGNRITFSINGTTDCKFPRTTSCYKCGWQIDYTDPVYKVIYSGRTPKFYHLCCYEVNQ